MIIEQVPEGQIPATVLHMINNPGIYLGSNPPKQGEAPLVSYEGDVYTITLDQLLDPTRFIAGTQIDGPFRPSTPDDVLKELCGLRDRLKQLSQDGYADMEGAAADEFEIANDLWGFCEAAAKAIDRAIQHQVKRQGEQRRSSEP